MRRRGWGRLVGAGWLASAPAFAALPVDLEDENEPTALVQFRHEKGYGPKLLECHLAADETLRCRLDEVPKSIECSWVEGGESRPLNVKTEQKAFVCAAIPSAERLSSLWRVLVSGPSGTVAEWVVEGRTAEQSREAHLREMKLAPNAAPFLDGYSVAATGLAEIVDGGMQAMGGVEGDLRRGPVRLGGGLDRVFIRATAGDTNYLPRFFLGYMFAERRNFDLEGSLGYRSFLRENSRFEGPEVSLRARWLGDAWRAGFELGSRYPTGVRLFHVLGARASTDISLWGAVWFRVSGEAWYEHWTRDGLEASGLSFAGGGALVWERQF